MDEIKLGKVSIPIIKGNDGKQGERGERGLPGATGKDGADGYTPVKGVDYWTEEDKSEIIGTAKEEVNKTVEELEETINKLEEENKRLLADHKPIPFNSSSSHIEDTGELPMPISINGGIEQETREGYNLLPLNYESNSITSNGVTVNFDKKTGIFKVTGKATEATWVNIYPTFKSGTNENDAGEPINALNKYLVTNTKKWGMNDSVILTLGAILNDTTANYKQITKETINRGYLYFPKTDKEINEEFWVMVCDDYNHDIYEQYGASPSIEYPSEVKGVSGHYDNVVGNKNTLKLDDIEEKTENGITYSIKNGVLKMNGTSTTDFGITIRKPFTFKKGTYAHQIFPQYKQGMFVSLQNKDFTKLGATNNSLKIFTLEEDTTFDYYLVWVQNRKSFNNEEFTFQIEENTVGTTFAEHQEQNYALDIPFNMYSGKPYKENGKWYRDVEFKKYVFTGDENLNDDVNGNGLRIFANSLLFKDNVSRVAYVNYFKITNDIWTLTEKKDVFKFSDGNMANINIMAKDYDTAKDFKAKLKELYDNGTPLYIIYKTTPTKEEITDTTLIKQLEELQKAHSYKEVTNINSYAESGADLVLSGNALMSNDIRLSKLESALVNIGGI